MLSSPEQALGALLVLLALLDVFLTVLYARLGTSIVSRRLARGTWLLFRRLAEASGRRRGTVLSLCGPVVLVLLVLAWALALTLGTALIIHPVLGTAIARSDGQTPTDFLTAMYAGGSSMTIVGSSDFAPLTGGARLFYLFTSLVGMSVMSLTLTYLMQVYSALLRRNALGLKAELLSGGTGDAAELLARVGPEGQFQAGYTNLSSLAEDMVQAKEAHHFYPVLFYFRFREPYYSVSRFALVALDAASLIETALGDECRWLKRSASVEQLRRASLVLVTALEDTFLPGGAPEPREAPGAEHAERWRRRYRAGLGRLREAGAPTAEDERAGAEAYVALRAGWDRHVATLARSMAYRTEEIDPAGGNAGTVAGRSDPGRAPGLAGPATTAHGGRP